MNNQKIAPTELKNLSAETKVIDVRTPGEFKSKHLVNAINIPLFQLNQKSLSELGITEETPLVIVCQSGLRAEKACQTLRDLNHSRMQVLDGGMNACSCSSLEFIEGKGAISIERQVRIVAGSIIVIAILLGYFFHNGFLIISAFVGAGLAFSGITNTCGLALLLGMMPWNRK